MVYLAENQIDFAIECIGEEITISHFRFITPDYDDDIDEITRNDITITAQVMDMSKKDREFLDPKYDTNKMLILMTSKSNASSIAQDDYFQYEGLKYTIVQFQNDYNYVKVFCKYEGRL